MLNPKADFAALGGKGPRAWGVAKSEDRSQVAPAMRKGGEGQGARQTWQGNRKREGAQAGKLC